MRIFFGVMLFIGFGMFVTPVELAVVMSMSDGSGDPVGLLWFGLGAAAIFGIPGYFIFPCRRRLQAVAWLSFGCMMYSLVMFGSLIYIKANPQLPSAPETRQFMEKVSFDYGRLAAITAVQLAVWAALFLRRRDDPEASATRYA